LPEDLAEGLFNRESPAAETNRRPQISRIEDYRCLEAGRESTGGARTISALMAGRRPATCQHKGSRRAL